MSFGSGVVCGCLSSLSGIDGMSLSPVSGMLELSSLVNTDLNCSLVNTDLNSYNQAEGPKTKS